MGRGHLGDRLPEAAGLCRIGRRRGSGPGAGYWVRFRRILRLRFERRGSANQGHRSVVTRISPRNGAGIPEVLGRGLVTASTTAAHYRLIESAGFKVFIFSCGPNQVKPFIEMFHVEPPIWPVGARREGGRPPEQGAPGIRFEGSDPCRRALFAPGEVWLRGGGWADGTPVATRRRREPPGHSGPPEVPVWHQAVPEHPGDLGGRLRARVPVPRSGLRGVSRGTTGPMLQGRR